MRCWGRCINDAVVFQAFNGGFRKQLIGRWGEFQCLNLFFSLLNSRKWFYKPKCVQCCRRQFGLGRLCLPMARTFGFEPRVGYCFYIRFKRLIADKLSEFQPLLKLEFLWQPYAISAKLLNFYQVIPISMKTFLPDVFSLRIPNLKISTLPSWYW